MSLKGAKRSQRKQIIALMYTIQRMLKNCFKKAEKRKIKSTES